MNGDGAERADLELDSEHDIRYWAERFHCAPAELLAVVAQVGRSVAAVQTEVARRAEVKIQNHSADAQRENRVRLVLSGAA